jgi:hypothetical protein
MRFECSAIIGVNVMAEWEAMVDKRKYLRTPLNARVSITHDSLGTIELITADISDGGLFVHTAGCPRLTVGDEVRVRVSEVVDAPVLRAVVVRLTAEGAGLSFVDDDETP